MRQVVLSAYFLFRYIVRKALSIIPHLDPKMIIQPCQRNDGPARASMFYNIEQEFAYAIE